MTKLKFDRDHIKAMLDTVLADDAKIMLVKDDGVYLMSFGDKPANAGPDWKRTVAYARGFDPKKDAEVWDKSRDAMGGDDGGDEVGTKAVFLEMLEDSVGDLVIHVTPNSLRVAYLPKNAAPPKPLQPLDIFKGATTKKWRAVHSIGADGKPILYNVTFAKKSEAVAFVKALKANATMKAMHDGVVARMSQAGAR